MLPMYSVLCIIILGWTIAGSTLNEVQDIGEAGSQKDNTVVQMEVEPKPLDLPQLRKQCQQSFHECQVIIDTMVLREEDSNLQKAKALATNQTQSGITSEHDEACQAISNTLRTQNKELREKVKICSKKKGKVQPLKTEPAANNVGKGMPDDAEEVHVVLPCLALCVICLYSIHAHQDMTACGCPVHTPLLRRLQLGSAMV